MPRMRREKMIRWVHRGLFAVAVPIEVVYPVGDPSEPCIEPATARLLDEVARRAEAGDLDYLRSVGSVFRAVKPRIPRTPSRRPHGTASKVG